MAKTNKTKGIKGLMLGIIFLFAIMFSISNASAGLFDNYYKWDADTNTALFQNFIGWDLMSVQLLENTYQCGTECYAIMKITAYADISEKDSAMLFSFKNGGSKEIIPVNNPDYPYLMYANEKYEIDESDKSLKSFSVYVLDENAGYKNESGDIVNSSATFGKYLAFTPREIQKGSSITIKIKGRKDALESIEWYPHALDMKITELATWSVFNNSLGTETFQFAGNENITRYLAADKYGEFIAGIVNLTGSDDGSGNYPSNPWLEIGTPDGIKEWSWNNTLKSCSSFDAVSYWKLEQGNGTFFVDTMGLNNGTCSGASCPTYNASGKVGGAYDFDGADDYIDVGNSSILNPTNVITIGGWVNVKGGEGTWRIMVGRWDAVGGVNERTYVIGVSTANRFYFVISGDGTDATAVTISDSNPYSLNTWYHIAGIWNGTTMKLFRNGIEVASASQTAMKQSPNTRTGIGAIIGRIGDPAVSLFNGTIDETAIWNRSLSQSEITDNYDKGLEAHGYCEVSPQKTNDFSAKLNDIVNAGCSCDGCSISGADCITPFTFHSDTAGNLTYDALYVETNDSVIKGCKTLDNNLDYVVANDLTGCQINTYTSCDCLLIDGNAASGATINGQGFSIIGNGSCIDNSMNAIFMSGSAGTDISVYNLDVKGFSYGFYLSSGVDNVNIYDMNFNVSDIAIDLGANGANYNFTITNITAGYTGYGSCGSPIGIYAQENNLNITDANINGFYYGIDIAAVNNVLIDNANINQESGGIRDYGARFNFATNSKITNSNIYANYNAVENMNSDGNEFDNISALSTSYGFYLGSSTNSLIKNSDITAGYGYDAAGVWVLGGSGNRIENSDIKGDNGVKVDGSSGNNLTNIVFNTSTDIYANAGDNLFVNMTFNSTNYPTKASFYISGSGSLVFDSSDGQSDSFSYKNISKYIDITSGGGMAVDWLNISYEDAVLTNESSLVLAKNSGAGWSIVPDSGLDDVNKIVYALNITSFSTFAPMEYTPSVGCGDTITSDTTLSSDLTGCPGNGLNIGADNIMLDCAGNSITGVGAGYGVNVTGFNNVTIKNCNISAFNTGIYLASSSNDILINSNISGGDMGVYFSYSDNNSIINSSASGSNFPSNGILLESSNGNIINEVAAKGNDNGIWLFSSSSNNQIINSNTIAAYMGIRIESDSFNNNVSNNYACGNSAYDIYDADNNTGSNNICTNLVSGGITCAYTCESSVIDCQSFDTPGAYYVQNDILDGIGICFNITANDVIIDCQGYKIEGLDGINSYGFDIISASGITIRNCEIVNFTYGIYVDDGSGNNLFENNIIHDCSDSGIALFSTANNTLTNNSITSSAYGIYMLSASNGTATGNSLNSNAWGLYFDASFGNVISGNQFSGSGTSDLYNTLGNFIITTPAAPNVQLTFNTTSLNATGGDFSNDVLLSSSSTNFIAAVNSSANPSLNTTAVITITGLFVGTTPDIYYYGGFTNDPELILTGVRCNDDPALCYDITYDNVTGILQFTVAHFSSYYGKVTSPAGASTFSWGYDGQMYGNFNGQNSYINSSLNMNITDKMTLIAWAKTSSPSVTQRIISPASWDNDFFSLRAIGGNWQATMRWNTSTTYNAASSAIAADTWYFLAGVVNNTAVSLYVNGVLQQSTAIDGKGLFNNSRTWEIGRASGTSYFNGSIDEVAIYNSSLSSAQVLALYNQYTFSSSGPKRNSAISTANLSYNTNFDDFSFGDASANQIMTRNIVNVTHGIVTTNLRYLTKNIDYSITYNVYKNINSNLAYTKEYLTYTWQYSLVASLDAIGKIENALMDIPNNWLGLIIVVTISGLIMAIIFKIMPKKKAL